MKVQDLMTSDVSCCQSGDSIQEAARVMQSLNVGSVPVCDNKKVVGIITDRDIAVQAVANGRPPTTAVTDCMSKKIVSCTPDTDAHEAADLMSQHQIRRLPVVSTTGELVGICSIGDLATIDIHVNEAGNALSKISQPTASSNAVH